MEKNFVICDTNIFIHWFNNDKLTIEKLEEIGLERIAVSSVINAEVICLKCQSKQTIQLV
jgi:predicted nucleic acid-binding protein